MKRIRDFFCTVDPMVLSIAIVVIGVLFLEAAVLGGWKMLGIAVIGLVLVGLMIGIGWLLFKCISWAQSHCND